MNRIKEIRQRRGVSAQRLAEGLNAHRNTIVKLERGEMKLTTEWMGRIAKALECAPSDLISNGDSASVPITVGIAAAGNACRCEGPAYDKPHELLPPPPGLKQAEDCFAARVEDDSASRLYPEGSTLIVRRVDRLDQPLRVGSKVLVAHYRTTRAENQMGEVIVGILDRTMTGEIVLLTRSDNRDIPSSIIIQQPAAQPYGVSDRFAVFSQATDPTIIYEPRAGDRAEILGRVVMAITPE